MFSISLKKKVRDTSFLLTFRTKWAVTQTLLAFTPYCCIYSPDKISFTLRSDA